MKLLALAFLIIGNLVATEAFAQDVALQPLTRADCVKAAMVWNDSANVCVGGAGIVSARPLTKSDCGKAGMSWDENAHVCGLAFRQVPDSGAAVILGQPLTRKDCDLAGMTWDNTANVCGAMSKGSATQATLQTTNPVASTIHHHRQDHSKDDRLC